MLKSSLILAEVSVMCAHVRHASYDDYGTFLPCPACLNDPMASDVILLDDRMRRCFTATWLTFDTQIILIGLDFCITKQIELCSIKQ